MLLLFGPVVRRLTRGAIWHRVRSDFRVRRAEPPGPVSPEATAFNVPVIRYIEMPPTEETMDDNSTPIWRPISFLPTYTDLIDGTLEEAKDQLALLEQARPKPYALDDATVSGCA